MEDEEYEKFLLVIKEIVNKGYFENKKYKGYLEVVSKICEVEILFFDPIEYKTYANSQIYIKAFEKILCSAKTTL